MKSKDWAILIGVVIVIALVVSLVTVNLTGNVIKLNQDRFGKNRVYTTAEVDAKLNNVATNQGVLDMLKNKCINEVFSSRGGWWSKRNELDLNGDTVVTGDEFCKVLPNSACLWQRRISYNTFSSLRGNVITSVVSETNGCAGGENNQFYEDNSEEGMEIFCCSP